MVPQFEHNHQPPTFGGLARVQTCRCSCDSFRPGQYGRTTSLIQAESFSHRSDRYRLFPLAIDELSVDFMPELVSILN
jgi:hypothetical protein